MSRQNEITSNCIIPDEYGHIANPGWARSEVMQYTRGNLKAPWFRKKEWDYYLFNNDKYAVAFTISDLGYVGLVSASFIDLEAGTEHTESELVLLPRGKKFGLGASVPEAHAECHTKRLDLVFDRISSSRRSIRCSFSNFDNDKCLTADLTIDEPDLEEMFICTPWKEKDTRFYYNCKKNCLKCSGSVAYGGLKFELNGDSCFGVLDWGRGIWTYDNTWYWGTGSGLAGGEVFGFNLGYGFSDRSSCSENVLYCRGKVHKLDEIDFGIPSLPDGTHDYLKPWHVTSNDNRFDAVFTPILDRKACMDFKLIVSDQHQVFGRMTGFGILDDGTRIEFKDFVCALEEVHNRY